jgi:preprotein translocase subunit SecE
MKRQLQRQGQIRDDGSPAPQRRQPPQARPAPGTGARRTAPAEFVKDVRSELRKVAWPSRAEVVNYSTVVLFTLVVLTALIFVLDLGFQKWVTFLFKA